MNSRLKLGAAIIFFEIVSRFVLDLIPRHYFNVGVFGISVIVSPAIYYVVAGGFSFLVIKYIAKSGNDQLVSDMVLLALIMLATQILGLFIYHSKLPVEIYNCTIHTLVALQFLRLLWKRGGDGVDRDSYIVFLARSLTMQRDRNLC